MKPQSTATATTLTVPDVMREPEPVVERSAHLAGAAYMMRHAKRPELVVVDDEQSLAGRSPSSPVALCAEEPRSVTSEFRPTAGRAQQTVAWCVPNLRAW